jgi:RNA polymerase sigma factor (sigma-70 family)
MGMTAEPLPISDDASDHELVRASLAGDRDAFGRLVERHQAAVCAITYAAAGKLHLGQDLAQETFLEAWRSLGALRDAGQLRAWLCGIARNVAQNALRRRGADTVPERAEETSDERTPEASALANEETRLVWQAMADIPADYREPLILFYWQEQSARRVGETLGLSEDAVKQRLSRGRKLLRREVETLIADGLLRLRPGATFTAAVLAALPLGAREAAAAGAATLAHSTAAKLAGGLGAAGAGGLAGALVGVGGAFIGARASIVNTRSPRERRFMVQMVWVAVALSTVMVALQLVVAFFFRTLFTSVAWHVAVGTVETAVILWLVVRTNRRQRQIQVQEGTAKPPPPPAPHARSFAAGFTMLCLAYVVLAVGAQHFLESRFPEFADSAYGQLTFVALYGVGLLQLMLWAGRRRVQTPDMPAAPHETPRWTPSAVYQSLGGGIGGSLCWMLPMCAIAGDWATALAVVAAGMVLFRWGAAAVLRTPDRYFEIASRVFAALGGLTLLVVNLRWEAWMVFYRQSSFYQASADLPLWAINLLIVVVVGWTTIPLARRGGGG